MPPPRYSWHSVMPNRGMYPYLLHLHEEVCPWSSITLVELSDPNLASMPLRSLSVVSHMRRAPGGETQALSRYGLIPRTRAIASPDSSLLRHWLSHHLRSWVNRRFPYRTVSSDKSKLDSKSHSPVGDHTTCHVKVKSLKVNFILQ